MVAKAFHPRRQNNKQKTPRSINVADVGSHLLVRKHCSTFFCRALGAEVDLHFEKTGCIPNLSEAELSFALVLSS